MPRPKKWRRVCATPRCARFAPQNGRGGKTVVMGVDEYETIRLIDLEGLTQEQCAAQMDVARTTVQAMYASARRKLAQCIVLGAGLEITGGEYQMCPHRQNSCGPGCCRRHCGGGAPQQEENGEDSNE